MLSALISCINSSPKLSGSKQLSLEVFVTFFFLLHSRTLFQNVRWNGVRNMEKSSGMYCVLSCFTLKKDDYIDFLLLFRVYIFREPFLMVADPDMIKEILVKEFSKFHDRKVNIGVIF